MKVCYFGDYDRDYARNRIIIRGLKQNGVDVVECHINDVEGVKRYLTLVRQLKELNNKYDIIVVGYSISRLWVPLAQLFSKKPVVWDAFLSLYDSWVYDRQLTSSWSLKARYYWFLDWLNGYFADGVLVDTKEHAKYFSKEFHIPRKKLHRIFIGADNSVFTLKRE